MRRFILFISLLVTTTLWAQKTVVTGTVVDGDSGKPIMGANVTAAGVTVITNAEGYFILKSDTTVPRLTVSHIGYQTSTTKTKDQPLSILLKPTTIQLKEVIVMGDDPRELVLKAISKIQQNYSKEAEIYHCFYRETAMKRKHYISIAEGIVDMYKTGYGRTSFRDRVAIRKGRRLLSSKRSDTLSVKVIGGPVTPVELDLVKNTDLILNAEELENYELKMEMPTAIGERRQYVVSLKPRRILPYPLYYGRLFIDQQTLAFTHAELSLDMSDRRKATEMMLVRKPRGVRFRPKELTLQVDYRQQADGRTRISYVRTTFRFNCDWRRRLFATSFTAFCEMAVTSHDTSDVKPIRGRSSFDQRDAFFDHVDDFRDPAFWNDYNIIEPTETLDKAVDRLLKKRASRAISQ